MSHLEDYSAHLEDALGILDLGKMVQGYADGFGEWEKQVMILYNRHTADGMEMVHSAIHHERVQRWCEIPLGLYYSSIGSLRCQRKACYMSGPGCICNDPVIPYELLRQRNEAKV